MKKILILAFCILSLTCIATAVSADGPLTLSNLRFDAAKPLPADCIASITDTSAAFHYVYSCAQGLMQQLMVNGMVRADQNYPNPLEAASGFKTTIPFATTAEGSASIRIVDANGKEVLNDNEDVTYAGQHFFYFSGDRLPAGTYYYQIEFPKGVVVVNKTLLIVK